MPAEKTDAVVLRVVDFSETSCVVTLFTLDFGKVSALAKGARRSRSPFDGAIDLLSICRIVFLRKNTDALDLLTEAKLLRRFRGASVDLARMYAGMYVVQLLSAMTDHAEPQPSVYRNLVRAIVSIDGGAPVAESVLRFEWRLLSELGHLPSLDRCVECGKPVVADEESRMVSFGLMGGGVLCSGCRPGKRSVVQLHGETVDWLRHWTHESESSSAEDAGESEDPLEVALSAREQEEIPPRSRGEMRGLLDQYYSGLLGYRPGTSSLLRQVFRD